MDSRRNFAKSFHRGALRGTWEGCFERDLSHYVNHAGFNRFLVSRNTVNMSLTVHGLQYLSIPDHEELIQPDNVSCKNHRQACTGIFCSHHALHQMWIAWTKVYFESRTMVAYEMDWIVISSHNKDFYGESK